ncbi:MAG: hypothetical protein Q9160_008273 [Pyrenula sp. 1 TL-2023]
MGSSKRKTSPTPGRVERKRQRVSQDGFDNRSTKSKTAAKASKPNFGSQNSDTRAPASLLPPQEPPAFPRGGGSVLTPIERKQIQAQAAKDALFELNDQDEVDDASVLLDDLGKDEEIDKNRRTPSKKLGKKSLRNGHTKGKLEGHGLRIEGLTYKRITSGSVILGQIEDVSPKEITFALPNNLTGYAPLTAVSGQFTERLENVLARADDSTSDVTSTDDGDIDLKNYFLKGQFLRTYVTSTTAEFADGGKPNKKRLELSIEPSLCNTGMTFSDLIVNNTVQASITSVEDHGVIMDLGVENGRAQGFLPLKELDSEIQAENLQTGMVFLCLITGQASNGRTIKLSINRQKSGAIESSNFLSSAPTVNSLLPGTAVEVLVTENIENGLICQFMGMLDVTADLVHSGKSESERVLPEASPGTKVKGRLICTFPLSDNTKLGFSILDHVVQLKRPRNATSLPNASDQPHISDVIPDFRVTRVEPGLGLFASVGKSGPAAFLHISRLDDKKVETISASTGSFRVGTSHRGRIVGYNAMDDLYLASFQQSIIDQPFLRIDDVEVGQKAKGKVEKFIYRNGELSGLLVSLAEGIMGLVPIIHLADTHLQNPEKKFQHDMVVKTRVISKNVEKRQIRLTLKKALVNNEIGIWKTFADIAVGKSSLGTLLKVESKGAVVQFFGDVKGYLPVSEMSEAYINDATQHFREGQVIKVSAIEVDPTLRRLLLSCKDPEALIDEDRDKALLSLRPGLLVTGKVFQKNEDDVLLRMEGDNVVGRLEANFLSDGSPNKRQSAMRNVRAGQTMRDLLVMEVLPKLKLVRLCKRPSLVKAASEGQFPDSVERLREGMGVKGFVINITDAGVFVRFAADLTGLLPRSQMPSEIAGLPQYGMSILQTITTTVHSISTLGKTSRFWLTMKPQPRSASKPHSTTAQDRTPLDDPVDRCSNFLDDFTIGYKTSARVVSVKATQINVELAKEVQGRIDVSEIFDDWKAIKDTKRPLKGFQPKQILSVRVLGIHDARNHRFLPISHRSGKSPVFELSAKPSFVNKTDVEILSLDNLKVDSFWPAFVNNTSKDCLWVNITPNIRGRVKAMDLSDDVAQLADLGANFPIGSALKVRVLRVDVEKNQLDLSAKAERSSTVISYKNIAKGMNLPGRVTKSSERQVLVQLNDSLVGAIDLIEMADDFAKADPTKVQKNDIVRVHVVDVDAPNKRISLSIRPSKVLSSSLPVIDPQITSIDQIQLHLKYRGFISNVADNGLFVVLGHGVTAFVRVSDLSDSYLKDWKAHFERDQLVRGRVIGFDKEARRVQLSLKDSVLKPDYSASLTFDKIEVGSVLTGKVVKVEDFGVFILIDNSSNVRGLCHRSEIAESRVEDVRPLYSEGDIVKVKVLKVDLAKRRINFGLKASYFEDEEMMTDLSADEDPDQESAAAAETSSVEDFDAGSQGSSSADDEYGGMGLDILDDEKITRSPVPPMAPEARVTHSDSLKVGGFDWAGLSLPNLKQAPRQSKDTEDRLSKRPKQKSAQEKSLQTDHTGDLDAYGPLSADDFERLLLSEPDSSVLWLQYMAFQLEMGEIELARQIGERALGTIGIGRDDEKLNIWVGLLNLENTYGDDESVQDTFKRACEYNDPQEIHNRLTSILIQSGKHEKAGDSFQTMLKKYSQDPKTWINYATYLFDSLSSPDKARDLLPRAMQALPQHTHVDLTSKFAQLEFRSPNGLPERGRTIFEGLLSSFPKRVDLWNVLVDLEIRQGDKDQVRRLFERIFEGRVKNKQAKYFFKRWLAFEEHYGDERNVEKVKARAADFVNKAAKR